MAVDMDCCAVSDDDAAFMERGTAHEVRPHGREWKAASLQPYVQIMANGVMLFSVSWFYLTRCY